MDPKREIAVDMPEDEWAAMMNETDREGDSLSAAAIAALLSADPLPAGLNGARCFRCSVAIARELLPWCEVAAARWVADDPEASAVLERAVRNLRFALWRVGEGPPPEPSHYRPS